MAWTALEAPTKHQRSTTKHNVSPGCCFAQQLAPLLPGGRVRHSATRLLPCLAQQGLAHLALHMGVLRSQGYLVGVLFNRGSYSLGAYNYWGSLIFGNPICSCVKEQCTCRTKAAQAVMLCCRVSWQLMTFRCQETRHPSVHCASYALCSGVSSTIFAP